YIFVLVFVKLVERNLTVFAHANNHYALCRRRHNAYNAVLSNIRFAKRGTAKSRWFDSRIAFKNAFSYVAILGEPSNRRTASPQRILRIKKPDDLRRFLHFLCCLRLLHNFNSIGFPDVPAIQDCSGTYRPGMFHTIDDSFARQNRQPGGRSPFLFLGILQQGILAWNTYNSLNFPLLGEPC